MTRQEAIDYVLGSIAELVRHGNGVEMRDGSHSIEHIEGRIQGRAEMLAASIEPGSTMQYVILAADLAKLTIEKLLEEEKPDVARAVCPRRDSDGGEQLMQRRELVK